MNSRGIENILCVASPHSAIMAEIRDWFDKAERCQPEILHCSCNEADRFLEARFNQDYSIIWAKLDRGDSFPDDGLMTVYTVL